MDNLLLDEEGLKREGFEFFKINRGGDITYHGRADRGLSYFRPGLFLYGCAQIRPPRRRPLF